MIRLGDILVEAVDEMEEERMVNAEIISWLNRISVSANVINSGNGIDVLRDGFCELIRERGTHNYSRYIGQFFDKPNVFRRYVLEFINQNPECIIDDELSRFGGNIEKMIKSHRDAWDFYSFEDFIKPEYMDKLLEFMLPNATFFRRLKLSRDGNLMCHRAINVDKDYINDLWDGLGIYWTFGKTAFSYDNFFGEEFSEGSVYTITFHAMVPASSVSIIDTFEANTGYFDSEEEITVSSDSPVILYGVDVMDYKTRRKWSVPLPKRFICLA